MNLATKKPPKKATKKPTKSKAGDSRVGASFGEFARKHAGIVRSGCGDLSTREGFGD